MSCEQEMKELAALAYRDTTAENREYWKNEMGQALREIQQVYEDKLDTMRTEIEASYSLKVSNVAQLPYYHFYATKFCEKIQQYINKIRALIFRRFYYTMLSVPSLWTSLHCYGGVIFLQVSVCLPNLRPSVYILAIFVIVVLTR